MSNYEDCFFVYLGSQANKETISMQRDSPSYIPGSGLNYNIALLSVVETNMTFKYPI